MAARWPCPVDRPPEETFQLPNGLQSWMSTEDGLGGGRCDQRKRRRGRRTFGTWNGGGDRIGGTLEG